MKHKAHKVRTGEYAYEYRGCKIQQIGTTRKPFWSATKPDGYQLTCAGEFKQLKYQIDQKLDNNNHKEESTMNPNSTEKLVITRNRPSREELIEACKPLVDMLYKYYSPHACIMVSQAHVEILEGDMVAKFELRD